MGKTRKAKKKHAALEGVAVEVLSQRGEEALEHGDYAEAKRCLSSALKKTPDDAQLMYLLASSLLELGEVDEARRHLVTCCELEPDSKAERWLSLAELEEGKESLKCLEKASVILERQLANPPAEAAEDKENSEKDVRRQLSTVYCSISELFTTDLCDEENAEQSCTAAAQKALELDPTNPEALQAKAHYHLIKEEFPEAKEDMQRSLELWMPLFERMVEGDLEHSGQIPPFNSRLSAVKLLLELDMTSEANQILDGLVLEDEDCVDVWYLLGWLNHLQGKDYMSNAKYYLNKAAKVAKEFGCDDDQMMTHISELLVELRDVQSDSEGDDDGGEWETEEED